MLNLIHDDDLADPAKAALYGETAIAAERARRQRARTVDLRGADEPRDPWDAARQLAGPYFDAVATAGLKAVAVTNGDPFTAELSRREQLKRRETQRVQFEVAIGTVVTLLDGTQLGAGAELTPELVAHPHAAEVLRALVDRGCVSEISAHVAWLRRLDPSIGPYVVCADSLQVGTRTLLRGQSVSEADFPPLEPPRRFADGEPAAELTVGDLRRLISEQIDLRVPGSPLVRPPMSEFHRAQSSGVIERAPNYVASADTGARRERAIDERSGAAKKKGFFR